MAGCLDPPAAAAVEGAMARLRTVGAVEGGQDTEAPGSSSSSASSSCSSHANAAGAASADWGAPPAHGGDADADCSLTPAGHAWLLRELARAAPSAPVVIALEGGYNVNSIARGFSACVIALLGGAEHLECPPIREALPSARAAIQATIDALKPHWGVLMSERGRI